jgi:hypothetical protein
MQICLSNTHFPFKKGAFGGAGMALTRPQTGLGCTLDPNTSQSVMHEWNVTNEWGHPLGSSSIGDGPGSEVPPCIRLSNIDALCNVEISFHQ